MVPDVVDTPNLGIRWCPGCDPNRDPTREILDVHPCEVHCLQVEGWFRGGAGLEGASPDNNLWCDLIHRGRTTDA